MIAVVDVAFFLIILFVVLLLACLVALLSRKFPQWQLSWRIVLFCAGCAILLAAVLPRLLLSWANLEMTVAVLFICAVGGAWAAAKLPECMPVMSPAVASPVMAEASILPIASVGEKQQEDSQLAQVREDDKQEKPLSKKEEKQRKSLATKKNKASKVVNKETVAVESVKANTVGEKPLPAKPKKPAPIAKKSVEAVESQTIGTALEPVMIKMPETEPEKPAATGDVTESVAADSVVVSEDLPAAAVPEAEASKESSSQETVESFKKTEEIPTTFVNVDACLEEAWRFREAGSWKTAQQVLQAGIAQFADDEELPFLLIEEGALLKRYGCWDEAIAALETALALPQVKSQPVWQKDIQQTLGYLQIFLGVLRQLKLEAVAPEAIPASVLERVEAVYQQWRSRQ